MGSLHFAYELALPDLRAWPLERFPYVVFYVATSDEIDVSRWAPLPIMTPAVIVPEEQVIEAFFLFIHWMKPICIFSTRAAFARRQLKRYTVAWDRSEAERKKTKALLWLWWGVSLNKKVVRFLNVRPRWIL